MRNLLRAVIAVLCVFLVKQGFAQNRFRIGPRAMFTENIRYNSDADSIGSSGPAAGYSVGVVSELKVVGPLSIRAEALYSKKSFSETANFIDSEGNTYNRSKINTSLHYAEVPVMAKLTLGLVVKPYVLLGGYGAAYLGGRVDYAENIPAKDKSYSANAFDYGLSGGLGVDVNLKVAVLFAELRTNIGLASIDNSNSRIANAGVGVGVRF